MDAGTVVIIVLAVIIALAAIAIIAQAVSLTRKASAEAYSTRMNANAAVVSRMAGRADHAIDIDFDGVLTVTPRDVVSQVPQAAQTSEQEPDATDDEIKAWQIAVDWVAASVAANPQATQLISGAAFGSGSGYDAASRVMRDKHWITTVRGGGKAGAYVDSEIGTVTKLLPIVALESAIKSRPRPAERVAG